MPYTNKSLACLWLILGLFALTASDVVARSWLPPLLLVALAAPTLILKSHEPVAVIARSRSRPRIMPTRGISHRSILARSTLSMGERRRRRRAVPSGQVARCRLRASLFNLAQIVSRALGIVKKYRTDRNFRQIT